MNGEQKEKHGGFLIHHSSLIVHHSPYYRSSFVVPQLW